MNINAAIIDQRLVSVIDTIRSQAADELGIRDANKLKSLAFVYFCVQTILDLEDAQAFDCLTEGGGDFGVDAIHISEDYEGEFTVSLIQAKYKNDLEGKSNFPESGINALLNAIRFLFDPTAPLDTVNDRLLTKVEAARSLIRDGSIPQVRAIACNNGLRWNTAAQEAIDRANLGHQVTWEHQNHDDFIKSLQASKPIKDTLQLSGQAVVEDLNFSRVLVGRIAVTEIAALIDRHGERLLERNIRRYLGLQGNRINQRIQQTLTSDDKTNFYFYNNGITLTCDNFSYNALQKGDYQVKVDNLQIINGGQTCMTIFKTLQQLDLFTLPQEENTAYVLVRLYQLPSDNDDLVRRITYATNSQNPVDLRDLRANDDRQKTLELDIENLGFRYQRKRSGLGTQPTDLTPGSVAEAVLAVWRDRPHQAKFFTREHFGKLYDLIFTEKLNGSQVVLAVKLYRIAENRRKRPQPNDPDCVRYGSCFIAMQMGRRLLVAMNLNNVEGIDHQTFQEANQLIDKNGDDYFTRSVQDVQAALEQLYGRTDISLQQLSATFRRGDLIGHLPNRPN